LNPRKAFFARPILKRSVTWREKKTGAHTRQRGAPWKGNGWSAAAPADYRIPDQLGDANTPDAITAAWNILQDQPEYK
jgi:hypothetical protein